MTVRYAHLLWSEMVGGVEVYVKRWAEVEVRTYDADVRAYFFGPRVGNWLSSQGAGSPLRPGTQAKRREVRRNLHAVRQFHPDMVIAHRYGSYLLLPLFFRVRRVALFHGLDLLPTEWSAWRRWLVRVLVSIALRRCTTVAISTSVSEAATRTFGVSPAVVPTGVDQQWFEPSPVWDGAGPLRICVTGRLERDRRPWRALELAAGVRQLHPGVSVTVTFVGEGSLTDDLRDSAAALGVPTTFTGWLEAPLPTVVGHHIVLVCPQTEGLGLAAIEARLHGGRVLADGGGELPNLASDGLVQMLPSSTVAAVPVLLAAAGVPVPSPPPAWPDVTRWSAALRVTCGA